ncbi:MAG: helix-turn-helix domain-containing protein [Pseudomonadota bacterium]
MDHAPSIARISDPSVPPSAEPHLDPAGALTAARIGAAIRARRTALGLTQSEAAAKIGGTQRWVSQVENGKERAEIGAVLRLAGALGVRFSLEPEADQETSTKSLPKSPPRKKRRRAAYRAYLDAYRAAMREACAGYAGGPPSTALPQLAAEARRIALRQWAEPKLKADRAQLRSAAEG